MKKRKILFFHRSLKQSGATRQLVTLFRGIDRSRFDPFLVVSRTGRISYRDLLGEARILPLQVEKRGSRNRRWRARIRKLVEIIDREQPDCIQSFNPRSNAHLYTASFLRRLPPLYCSVRNTNQPLYHRCLEVAFQWRHQGLVVNSRAIREQLVRSGVQKRRIHVIENGVDTTAFEPCSSDAKSSLRRRHGISDRELLLLSVSRVHRQKDLETTLRAIGSLTRAGVPVRFINLGLAQDRAYHEELLKLAEEQNVASRCAFIHSDPDVADYYQMADAMVLASRYEGLPNALLENMATGGISVVSSGADNDQVIEDGVNGFKFPVGDCAELTRRLEAVARFAPAQRQVIGERARKDIEQRFTIQRMVQTFEDLYAGPRP